MKPTAQSTLHWLAGPAVALVGVGCVRWLGPAFAGRVQAIVVVAGYLLVPAGLAWFAARLGQRAEKRAAGLAEPRS
ncbi:MAG TPA: hypothetical protein VIM71_04650 [Lacunisphaera sp.]